MTTIKEICKDYGDRPGCLKDADDRYTMYFDDIGEQPLYWCTSCGPKVQALKKALDNALKTIPGFGERFEEILNKVEEEIKKKLYLNI